MGDSAVERGPETIEAEYTTRTPRSDLYGQRAERVMPGGDTRAVGFHAPYPLTLARGQGAFLWDVDGNRYVDLIGNYGSLVHGHAYPPIAEAITQQLPDGTVWPARSETQIALAELLVERVPSVEQVRFTNSGAEAAHLAIRTARLATGREKLLMASYGYHGQMHDLEPGSRGEASDRLLLAPYGDLTAFEDVISTRGAEIAAVFLEPVQGVAGIIEPPDGFLAGVHSAAKQAGVLFILDEVLTFRLSESGGQGRAGVEADLTMFGKLIGGGFPCGAVGGRAEIMAVLDPRSASFRHSGTFNGNLVTTLAGSIAVSHLTADRIEAMDGAATDLTAVIEDVAKTNGVPCRITQAGSLMNIFLSDHVPVASEVRQDSREILALHLACLNHGVFFGKRGMMAMSTALDESALDEAAAGIDAAMADVRQAFQ